MLCMQSEVTNFSDHKLIPTATFIIMQLGRVDYRKEPALPF